jgi:hypothetical protein
VQETARQQRIRLAGDGAADGGAAAMDVDDKKDPLAEEKKPEVVAQETELVRGTPHPALTHAVNAQSGTVSGVFQFRSWRG